MNVFRVNATRGIFCCFAILAAGCGKIPDAVVEKVAPSAAAENLAQNAMDDEQWDEAIAQFRKIVKSQPNNGNAWLNLGFCLMKVNKIDEAMETQVKAAKFEESRILANYNIACIHSLNKEADKALEYLKKAVDLGFDDYEFMTNDPDFDFIRQDPRYVSIASEMVAQDEDMDPSFD